MSAFPASLAEALSLATQVARVALAPASLPELHNTLLRRLLMQYGRHALICLGDGDCVCSWELVRVRVLEDTVPVERDDGSEEQIP